MPRQKKIEVTHDGVRRTYIMWYADDPPARREAIAFFRTVGDLFPAMNIPREVEEMPVDEATKYLRNHPIQEQWEGLTLVGTIEDRDLVRLQHIRELRRVWVLNGNVSDQGMKHLLWLDRIESLVLYSERLTDACLESIRQMSSLRTLDMQGSLNVSRSAFEEAVLSLPQIEALYAPEPP
ncbi:hypothetical protein [Sorangium sp. So ce426]|uniref:hypothetical protein n=1 Tax=Sorangium sp. So ce426 TaxID=3133312 RepID=UPI003F5BA81A